MPADYKPAILEVLGAGTEPFEVDELFARLEPGKCFNCCGGAFRRDMWRLIDEGKINLRVDRRLELAKGE